MSAKTQTEVAVPGTRVASFDAFRGMVMTLMMAEALRLPGLSRAFPGNAFWGFIAFHTDHVAWQGCSLHDLIQPGFSLLVGASLPFSIANRKSKGQSTARMFGHAVWRAVILMALGIFLRSMGKPQTNFTFEDTLTQIGLGYVFLFALGFTRVRTQAIVLALILIGYWAVFAWYPAPAPNFDYAAVGVPADWPNHYSGFLAHWNKNSNAAWAADLWFLNLFPRAKPFLFNGGGYCTFSFVPTLGTMIFGLLLGGWIKSDRAPLQKLKGMAAAGAGLVLAGLLCQWTGICPIVKRIWTPAFTLYSAGCVLLILSVFYALMDWKGKKRWAFPLVVVGMNSIAAYFMADTIRGFVIGSLNTHLGKQLFQVFGEAFENPLRGLATVGIFWLILFWMYRRKIFIRI